MDCRHQYIHLEDKMDPEHIRNIIEWRKREKEERKQRRQIKMTRFKDTVIGLAFGTVAAIVGVCLIAILVSISYSVVEEVFIVDNQPAVVQPYDNTVKGEVASTAPQYMVGDRVQMLDEEGLATPEILVIVSEKYGDTYRAYGNGTYLNVKEDDLVILEEMPRGVSAPENKRLKAAAAEVSKEIEAKEHAKQHGKIYNPNGVENDSNEPPEPPRK